MQTPIRVGRAGLLDSFNYSKHHITRYLVAHTLGRHVSCIFLRHSDIRILISQVPRPTIVTTHPSLMSTLLICSK